MRHSFPLTFAICCFHTSSFIPWARLQVHRQSWRRPAPWPPSEPPAAATTTTEGERHQKVSQGKCSTPPGSVPVSATAQATRGKDPCWWCGHLSCPHHVADVCHCWRGWWRRVLRCRDSTSPVWRGCEGALLKHSLQIQAFTSLHSIACQQRAASWKKAPGLQSCWSRSICLPMRGVWCRADGGSGPSAGDESPTSFPSETQGSSTVQSAHCLRHHHFYPKCGGCLVRELVERWHIKVRSTASLILETDIFMRKKKKKVQFQINIRWTVQK